MHPEELNSRLQFEQAAARAAEASGCDLSDVIGISARQLIAWADGLDMIQNVARASALQNLRKKGDIVGETLSQPEGQPETETLPVFMRSSWHQNQKQEPEAPAIPQKTPQGISYIAYTDGSCDTATGFGGWGAVVHEVQGNARTEISRDSGAFSHVVAVQMEIFGAISALRATPKDAKLTIVTDCKLLVDAAEKNLKTWIYNGWRNAKNKPISHKLAWQALHKELQGRTVRWNWIKGHAGYPENVIADKLAVTAMKALRDEADAEKQAQAELAPA
jgi:ribonuclease HI